VDIVAVAAADVAAMIARSTTALFESACVEDLLIMTARPDIVYVSYVLVDVNAVLSIISLS
jgi:hypothetical protein